jgi:outer membrane protein assembly factor BamA
LKLLGTTVLKNKITKIALIIVSGWVLYSCSLVKRVPEGKHLLTKAEINVNGKAEKEEEVKDQLYQLPNTNILGYHVRLHLYNLAKKNADSSYKAWLERKPGRHERLTKILSEKQVQRLGKSFLVSGLSNFLKKTGEPPVIVDQNRIKKSKTRLNAYYYKKGFFRTKVTHTIDTVADKRAQVNYHVVTGQPYMLDSINSYIDTPVLDSLYATTKKDALLKKGAQYNEADFSGERERITTYFRNRGAYRFQQNNISYVVDTVSTGYKANVELNVANESVRQGDSSYLRPFKLYKISRVNIYTKNPTSEDQAMDSVTYNGFNIYSTGKLNYRPKAITDAIFIIPGSTFADFRRVLTSRYLSNLRVFNYPSIEYVEDSTDVTGSSLITNIYLNPRKKFVFNVTADFTHSNIQDFGVQGSLGLSIRNIFKGAEILQISTRGNIGSSRDLAIQDQTFFNISEYGADVKLTFPRIFFPLNTDKIIPKEMIPSTVFSVGVSRQRNIGLDKENFTGILNYNWTPRRRRNELIRYDLFNIQYIKNVNSDNYFNVYRSSYDRLNTLAQAYSSQVDPNYRDANNNLIIESGTQGFINEVKGGAISVSETDRRNINSIEERRQRLTENNLIFSSNFTYTTSTRANLVDNTFFILKTKLETAGNTLSLLSGFLKDQQRSASGNRTIFDVEYSQYIKGELDLIKHWDLRRGKVFAMRAFFGLAVPYGNSSSIPFTRSYFAGGSNDNRAWQSYSLGPGSSGGLNDFNEANLKLAASAELRFNIFGKLNGAIFSDVGNIWNVFDEVEDPALTFNGLKSFRDLALGTGVGFRYDFNFFVVRFDVGFKTYNPGRPVNDRWFKEYNLAHSVLNVGINYPF